MYCHEDRLGIREGFLEIDLVRFDIFGILTESEIGFLLFFVIIVKSLGGLWE